jgi:peroxiredoxin
MKSQAETAGRLTNSGGVHPQSGTVLHDVELTMADGARRLLSSLRGNSSLVMVFTAGCDLHTLLVTLAGRASTLNEHNARVLIVGTARDQLVADSEFQSAVFLLATDDDKIAHRTLGATDEQGNPVSAIYITDPFGEVFAAFRSQNSSSLPAIDEIIRWLEFISYQCEECSPREWPE